jgi:hypothetical protein
MPYLRQHHRRHWTPLVALVLTLVCVFLVLPVAASVIARIAQARWEAAHPPQTLVPNVTGCDPLISTRPCWERRNLKRQPACREAPYEVIQSRLWRERRNLRLTPSFIPELLGRVSAETSRTCNSTFKEVKGKFSTCGLTSPSFLQL